MLKTGHKAEKRSVSPHAAAIIPHMANYTQSIQNLMNELARLPGIGMRSSGSGMRVAHLLKQSPADAMKGYRTPSAM